MLGYNKLEKTKLKLYKSKLNTKTNNFRTY